MRWDTIEESLDGLEIADVKRCRKRALEFNCHPFPVFGPYDDIIAREQYVLGDLNYVTTPFKSAIKQFGYTMERVHACVRVARERGGVIRTGANKMVVKIDKVEFIRLNGG